MTADDIKYLALQELGFGKEPDFHDDGDNAVNAVNGQYEHLYDLALTEYEWLFCEQITELTAVKTDNERMKYKYSLPDDCLFVRGIYSDDYGTVIRRYYNDGRYIWCNAPVLYLRYTRKTCEELLPPWFIEYFKYKMAAKLCRTLTGDNDLLQVLVAREDEAFRTAKNADINQRGAVRLDCDNFLIVRQ